MKLTIGMATVEDFDGVYFSVQALRMYHNRNLELIVVDNKPSSKASPHLKNFLESWTKARYIPMPSPEGTTQSRNRVFAEATGDAVLCIDSHVLLAPGAVGKLINFYESNPGCNDLLTGPMLADDLTTPSTHFDDVWRAEMWGIWGRAWGCHSCPLHFSVLPTNHGPHPHTLTTNPQPFPVDTDAGRFKCPSCRTLFPKECTPQGLLAAGFRDLAYGSDPFEVPGQGLGLFSCRREAWLGFNKDFRGFGGEEMYIHEKYRQAGHRNLCLPFLKWGHRFGRPNGLPYVPLKWNKVRNYVLGHLELGLPLDRVEQHFVKSGLFPKDLWEKLLANPTSGEIPQAQTVMTESRPQPRASLHDHTELIAWVKENPRDLDQHVDKLAELAAKCNHVTEFTHRRESTVALLAAKKLLSYQAERDAIFPRLLELFPNKLELIPWDLSQKPEDITGTDMIFLDTVGTFNRLYGELQTYSRNVRRFIAIHDTHLYGEKGEDELPGMLPALRKFMTEQPQWSVIYHNSAQYGLTVLGCQDRDKPKLPSTIQMASNFAQAMLTYAGDGMQKATKEQLTARLEVCTVCEQRTNNRCAVCGCGLLSKASLRAMECPLNRWPKLEEAAT
jgi:glycosyl transferase family 2